MNAIRISPAHPRLKNNTTASFRFGIEGVRRLSILAAFASLLVLITACSKSQTGEKTDNVSYYTCTMHPSVHAAEPGKCPICGMEMVPVLKKTAAINTAAVTQAVEQRIKFYQSTMNPQETSAVPARDSMGMDMKPVYQEVPAEPPSEFTVPVQRQQQIGVTYGVVETRTFSHTLRVVGTVTYDKQRRWDYVARVEGYVKQLSVSSRGQLVGKNAPLLTLYSPDLLTAQNEFVDLLNTRDEANAREEQAVMESVDRLIAAAKQRMHLWNITDQQIVELEKTRQPQETLTLYSPFKGVVQDLSAEQGRRVMTGDSIVSVADLSVVWVWAQFYQDELPMLKEGLPIVIATSSYPGEKFNGKISLIDPFINDVSRTGRVRIDVENPDFKLRPDMYVDADLTMDMGRGLAVPSGAVLPTGQHNIVFVDKGEGKLEPRYIELGYKYGDSYEVKSGLKEGERVVTSANFLIDAEAKIQGALKEW